MTCIELCVENLASGPCAAQVAGCVEANLDVVSQLHSLLLTVIEEPPNGVSAAHLARVSTKQVFVFFWAAQLESFPFKVKVLFDGDV